MPVGRPTLLDRGTSLPRALNGRALGKAGEYWKSPLLRAAVRQEASTAGRSSAAAYLRCSRSFQAEALRRMESTSGKRQQSTCAAARVAVTIVPVAVTVAAVAVAIAGATGGVLRMETAAERSDNARLRHRNGSLVRPLGMVPAASDCG